MLNPKISIIMSTYNDERYIAQAIESAITQSFKDWEFIIINDASTDNTEVIVKKLTENDPRFIYVKNKKNLGQTINANIGLELATGKYIARLDGDDIWISKDKLAKQLTFLEENPDHVLVGTWAKVIDEFGSELYSLEYSSEDQELRKQMLIQNPFIHSSILVRKEDIDRVGYYNSTNLTSQDYELWLELGRRKRIHNIPEHLVQYRINPKGVSSRKKKKQFNETIAIIKKHRNFYPNYLKAIILWNIRKYYPKWLLGKLSIKIKRNLRAK